MERKYYICWRRLQNIIILWTELSDRLKFFGVNWNFTNVQNQFLQFDKVTLHFQSSELWWLSIILSLSSWRWFVISFPSLCSIPRLPTYWRKKQKSKLGFTIHTMHVTSTSQCKRLSLYWLAPVVHLIKVY